MTEQNDNTQYQQQTQNQYNQGNQNQYNSQNPMGYNGQTMPPVIEENVPAGIGGAFLFALIGGLLWFGAYQIGYIVGIVGYFTMILAMTGYKKFGKAEGKNALISSILITIVVIFLAQYLCLAMDVMNQINTAYKAGEVDFTISFIESLTTSWFYLTPEGMLWFVLDILIGYALAGVACYSYVRKRIAQNKAQNNQI